MKDWKNFRSIMRKHNGTLIRTGRHQVWRIPGVGQFSVSVSPSDNRAEINAVKLVEKALRQHGITER